MTSKRSPRMGTRGGAVVILLALLIAGCGSSGNDNASTSSSPAATTPAAQGGTGAVAAVRVAIKDFKFKPPTITVKQGGAVTWTNRDSAPHTATSDQDGVFTTDTLKLGQSKKVKFDKPGTYSYHCEFHRFMVGKLVVQ